MACSCPSYGLGFRVFGLMVLSFVKTISETYKNDCFLFKIESELEPKIFVKGRIMLSLLNKLDKNEI